ncbi:SDR family NAD(P)-dependent oxidoreductase [Nonomuraea sp. RK-328]|nr:SDR family NAD(P)-dependent oxidoreductase [Nonomuraea sp. RK-328]
MTNRQHKIGSGFGAWSTAEEVLAGIDLTGRTAVVTGGYSGLGLEIVRAFAGAGARVLVPARRPDAARAALRDIPRADARPLDLTDQADVRRFSTQVVADGAAIDVVVANAGVMACPETRVGPGWEAHFALHLGHHALVNHLRPAFAPGGARVVAVSSSGHFLSGMRWDDVHFRDGYDGWLAYAQAKTAAALFAVHLDRLGGPAGIHAYSVHPGSILTPLQRHVPLERQAELGWITEDGTPPAGFKSPAQGAATATWAATSPLLDDLGGVYCQDCDVAEPATTDDMLVGGVRPWAVDPAEAARLWALSAELTGVDAFS